MKIRKTTLSIGFNDKDTKKQEIASDKIKAIITGELLKYYGGFTMWDTYGAYTHDNGDVVVESGCCVVLYFTDEQKDFMLCESLKKQLNQESIAVESGWANSKLI
jgi:hypothetical protein